MYLALMDDAVLPLNRPLWKIKIPLKVKVFLWLLHRGVILTKDNLAKRNWNGSKLCSYCQNDETIAHLFFNCQMACLLWRIISITFGLSKPNSVVHLFGTWLQGLKRRQKNIMFPGLCALLWAVWLSRNDIVFQKTQKQTVLQILFRATYFTRMWAILQKEEDRKTVIDACRALEVTAMDIFAHNG